MNPVLADLYEEVSYLCEIRGELDPETNRRTEAEIKKIMDRIAELEAA